MSLVFILLHIGVSIMSISPINNQSTGFTGFGNDVINAGGQIVQGAQGFKNNIDKQQATSQSITNPKSLDSEQDVIKNGEQFDADIASAGEQVRQDSEMASLQLGAKAAHDKIVNTQISSALQAASGITY
jgi:hypothetical protein